jgi:hypothetical protein
LWTIFIGIYLFRIFNKVVLNTILILVVLINLLQYKSSYQNDSIISKINAEIEDNDLNESNIVLCTPYFMYEYAFHFAPTVFSEEGQLSDNLKKKNIYAVFGGVELENLNSQKSTIFIDYNSEKFHPKNNIDSVLSQKFEKKRILGLMEGIKMISYKPAN